MYNLFVRDVVNNVDYEIPFESISFTDELNVGANANIVLNYDAVYDMIRAYNVDPMFVLTAARRELWVEKNGTKVFYGMISDCQINMNPSGFVTLTVAAMSFFNQFAKRRTDDLREFIATDAGEIAWTLIDESQADPHGDLGITEGSITASVDRDRTFKFANIKDEITQMSNLHLANGFDFDIDNTKKFNVYYPTKGSQRANLVLDEETIMSWSQHTPLLSTLTNRVYVLGQGELFVQRDSDNVYKEAFGLQEDVLPARDIITTATLDDKGDKLLELQQAPMPSIDITHIGDDPEVTDYEVGDSLRVTIAQLGITDEFKRVFKRTVNIDSNGLATVTDAIYV